MESGGQEWILASAGLQPIYAVHWSWAGRHPAPGYRRFEEC